MIIGFIGTGAIAAAMVKALTGQGHDLRVSMRNASVSQELAKRFDDVSRHENQDLARDCDVVFLCLMADVAKAELPLLTFAKGIRIVSAMVDVDLPTLHSFAPDAASIDITIPLPQIESGGCPLPCYPAKETVESVFGSANPAFAVRDARALNAHFAASALMSTTLDQIQAASSWLKGLTGDGPAAEFYIAHMLSSGVAAVSADNSIEDMLQDLSTEGGLNATLKAHLRAEGVNETLTQGLDGFRGRLGLGDA